MAMSINTTVKPGRSDVFHLDLADILADDQFNSRKVPHTQEQIERYAHSILNEGQKQPALGRRMPDKKVQLVAGFGRFKAVKYINEVLQPGAGIRLQIRVEDMTDEQAFRASVTENLERTELMPIDKAWQHEEFRRRFGYSDEQIAQFYNYTTKYVEQLRDLLVLPQSVQKEMHDGNLKLEAGTALVGLPQAKVEEIVENAKDLAGKVQTHKVVQQVREHKVKQGQKGRQLNPRETREFLQRVGMKFQVSSPGLARILDLLRQVIRGDALADDVIAQVEEIDRQQWRREE